MAIVTACASTRAPPLKDRSNADPALSESIEPLETIPLPNDGRFDTSLEPAEALSRRKHSGDIGWKSSKLLARSAEPLRGFTPSSLPDDRMAVHVIDVGQADAFLLEFPCAAALIDTGLEYSGGSDSQARLRAYLQWFFDERRSDLDSTLDLVVISHAHADHANGIPVLLDDRPGGLSLKIRNVVDSGYDLKSAGEKQQRLRAAAEHSQSVSAAQIEWYSGATSSVIDPIGACDRSASQAEGLFVLSTGLVPVRSVVMALNLRRR
jgi:hypothetical protein